MGGGKGGGSSQREVTPEERALWDSQKTNLDAMTKIAQEQYNLSGEDRSYYEKVFREGSDTEAKDALAKLKSQITGTEVKPEDIKSVNIDSLLRDTILNSTPEFQKSVTDYINNSNTLTSQYGKDVSGLSSTFSKGVQDLTANYSNEIQGLKEATGTINQDVLARETGAQTAGVSTAYAEARKQMASDMARRGLAGSGVEATALSQTYQQEALAKASATSTARSNALTQSEAIRQQQAQYAGSQLQAGVSGMQTGYQADLSGVQNIYGVTSANALQNYQLQNASTLQGISGLTQLAQAGTGVYAGSQNYLAGASSTAGQAAQIAGSSASQLGQMNTNYALQQQQMAQSGSNALMGAIGGAAGMALGGGFGTVLGQSMFGSAASAGIGSTFVSKLKAPW